MITDFIKNVIGEKTDVVANGYSGSFSVLAGYSDTDYINKLILINPPSLASLNRIPSKRSKLHKFILELPVFGTLIYNIRTCQSNIQLLFTEKYLYNPFSVTPEMIDTYYEASHRSFSSSKFLLSSLVSGYTNNSINHALSEMNQSITVLSCEGEKESEKIAESYITCNPAIETSTLKNAKHLPQLETPEKFVELLNIYL